ncbi:uncharacterized protein ELE39_000860 [Cryptosporidium sp. chipmunk genotype I]|uniref:uncharacterized protein n=1 Tax=Cryptosporidium sp. chipmunk genotype I TaxID=1280935 RepID=UPI00351A2A80|nr:hypothetical protein ELE39_000860 [Cryptosporidium sp. chipmunk genotype I]
MESTNLDGEMGQEPIPSFQPEINEKSRQIAENLRKKSILELYDLITNGSKVYDLMSFQPSSVEAQKKMTKHQILAIQYFVPYVMKHSYKLEGDEIPDSIEKTEDLIKKNYNTTPIMVDFDEEMHLFVTRDSFLETMQVYLKLPSGKKFPIPIRFDKKGIPKDCKGEAKNDNSDKKNKERNTSIKPTKSQVGPQMEKAISEYLKRKQLINERNNNRGENGVYTSEIDPECTFQPNLRKTLFEKYRNELGINSITKNDECMQMIKKYLLLDNNDKDEKVESYFKSLQECTFQPNIEKFIKKGIPKEYYSKIKKENKEEVIETESSNKSEMVFFGKEESENSMDNERIQKERTRAINRIFKEVWNSSMNMVFNCESSKVYSNLIPISDELDSSKLIDDEMKNSTKKSSLFNNEFKYRIKYDWETREQGPIYDRETRQRLKQKKMESNSCKNTVKAQEKLKKKYNPPYKWEEDLRNESNKYQAKINSEPNNKQNENESQIFDKNKWERYIRLKDRHVKSIPVSNIEVVTNPEKGLDESLGLTNIAKCYSRICEITTPITVVGVRENIIDFLEKELEKPLPNLIEMFDDQN